MSSSAVPTPVEAKAKNKARYRPQKTTWMSANDTNGNRYLIDSAGDKYSTAWVKLDSLNAAAKKEGKIPVDGNNDRYFPDVNAGRTWYLFDASKYTLGRLASELTRILRGRHLVTYTPNTGCGDGVIVINAGQIKVTGKKADKKYYYRHSGYIGGLKTISFQRMLATHPTEILRKAVEGMMPRTVQSEAQLKRLRLFKDADHGMEAQQPVVIS